MENDMKHLTSLSVLTLLLVACGDPNMNDSAEDVAAEGGDAMKPGTKSPSASPDDAEPSVDDVVNPGVLTPDVDGDADPVPAQGEGGDFEALQFVACDGSAVEEVTVIDTDIVEDQTWSGVVYVQGEIAAASDVVVAIEPGTQVVMAAASQLDFDTNAEAVLQAVGTEQQPIQLCGEVAEAGSWGGLVLGELADAASQLEHVVITHAGAADGFALTLNGAASLRDVVVAESAGGGVLAVDFAADSENVSIESNAGIAAVLTTDAALDHLPQGGEITANGDNSVHLRFDEIAADVTVPAIDVPYVQEQDLAVTNDAVFTLEAGVDYRVADDASLSIGAEGEGATALFLGTAENSVSIQGLSEVSGSWDGIVVGEGASIESLLSHVDIQHAGADANLALDVSSQITLDHVSVTNSDTGIGIGAEGLSDESAALSVSGALGVPLELAANALVSLPEVEFSDNGEAAILVEAGAISSSGVIANLGLPYAVQGDIDTTEGSSVTIEAGVEFVMAEGSQIEIGADGSEATIVADGSADAMISFHGESAGAGVWQGIVIGSAVSAESSFDYVEIRDAGGGSLAAALTLESAIEVTNSSFVDSEGSGILTLTADATDYASANTLTDVEVAVATAASAELPQ
jgi:hypothetical protein